MSRFINTELKSDSKSSDLDSDLELESKSGSHSEWDIKS